MTTPTVILHSAQTGSQVATESYVQALVNKLVDAVATVSSRISKLESSMADVGLISMVAGNSLPPRSLWCHGQSLARKEYPALFDVIGTTFGGSEDRLTFKLPDFRGLFPRGAGVSGIGKKANGQHFTGELLGTVQLDQIQGHFHQLSPATSPSMYAAASSGGGSGAKISGNQVVGSPTEDATNGVPRTGDETRPASLSVEFCIRYCNP